MANFMDFAEKAIERAGKAGERRREHQVRLAGMGNRARMAELERAQSGTTRRRGMVEAGSESRHKREYARPWGARPKAQQGFRYTELERKQEFARPYQAAETERSKALGSLREAEAGKIRYGTEFKGRHEDVLKDILAAEGRQATTAAEEAELGFSEAERGVSRRNIAEEEAARIADIESVPEVTAKSEPGRELNPELKSLLLKTKVSPFGSLESYSDILKMLGKGTAGLYNTAFPKKRSEASGTW